VGAASKILGYPQRFAQEALGHSNRAVHDACARAAIVICPPLDAYENVADVKIISLTTASVTQPNVAIQK
jgi:hypothetical protein